MSISNKNGFWGTPTATIDWCERNYEVTYYIAEFWNTVTNLVMILFPIYSVYWSLKQRSKQTKQLSKLKKHNSNADKLFYVVPMPFIYCQLGLMMVGIGSWMFHMTLLYSMQLLDELPMIWASAILIYSYYDLIEITSNHKKSYSNLVLAATVLYCIVVSVIYVFFYKDPVFHEVAYGIMVFFIVFESIYLIRKFKLSSWLSALSIVYYGSGFVLWNVDNKFCSYLQAYRTTIDSLFDLSEKSSAIKLLLSILIPILKSISEFHGLWHILTGYGTWLILLFLIETHHKLMVKQMKEREDKQNINRPLKRTSSKLFYYLNKEFA